jgi:polar amino acid transport system substrate-binding protein
MGRPITAVTPLAGFPELTMTQHMIGPRIRKSLKTLKRPWRLGLISLAMLAVTINPLAVSAQEKAPERFYIFTENYPPYNASENGRNFEHRAEDIKGICTEMVKAMLENVNYDIIMKMRDWSRAYDWVQGRENHGLFCTARTDAREDQWQWVGPLASIKWTLFAAPDSNITLNSLEDARKYEIAGYKGDVMTEYLLREGFDVTTSVSDEANPRRLVLGQVDLWVVDGVVGPQVAKEQGDIEGLKPVLVFRETPMYLAVSKKTDPQVVKNLQQGLDKARDEGRIQAISDKYFKGASE